MRSAEAAHPSGLGRSAGFGKIFAKELEIKCNSVKLWRLAPGRQAVWAEEFSPFQVGKYLHCLHLFRPITCTLYGIRLPERSGDIGCSG